MAAEKQAPREARGRGGSTRRLMVLLVILAGIAIPPGILRLTCAAGVCGSESVSSVRVPFCSLPASTRDLIAAGFLQERSPDVVAVTGAVQVRGAAGRLAGGVRVPWLSTNGTIATQVPIVLWGSGVDRGRLPRGTDLRDVAPTLARVLDLQWPAPEAATAAPSGRALGVARAAGPRLVVEVAWEGMGTEDLRAHPGDWPFLRSLFRDGAGTLDGGTGSLPVDPAATLTTLGTGGLPSEHGITGGILRSPYLGGLTRAWASRNAPTRIPTLADQLDRVNRERSLIGLEAPDVADRGLIGGFFYVNSDRDGVDAAPRPAAAEAADAVRMLGTGFGADATPDLFAAVVRGTVADLDRATATIVRAARRASGGSVTVVVTGTGSLQAPSARTPLDAASVVGRVEREIGEPGGIQAAGPGGLFLRENVSTHDVAAALEALRGPGGQVMSDAFPAFAVSLARFC